MFISLISKQKKERKGTKEGKEKKKYPQRVSVVDKRLKEALSLYLSIRVRSCMGAFYIKAKR